jgi:hypothetical protein
VAEELFLDRSSRRPGQPDRGRTFIELWHDGNHQRVNDNAGNTYL